MIGVNFFFLFDIVWGGTVANTFYGNGMFGYNHCTYLSFLFHPLFTINCRKIMVLQAFSWRMKFAIAFCLQSLIAKKVVLLGTVRSLNIFRKKLGTRLQQTICRPLSCKRSTKLKNVISNSRQHYSQVVLSTFRFDLFRLWFGKEAKVY